MIRKFLRLLRQPAYDPVKIPARVVFVRDAELERRIAEARAKLPVNSVRPDRVTT